jgi:hypothetical protein
LTPATGAIAEIWSGISHASIAENPAPLEMPVEETRATSMQASSPTAAIRASVYATSSIASRLRMFQNAGSPVPCGVATT